MTRAAAASLNAAPFDDADAAPSRGHVSPGPWALALRSPRVRVAGGLLLVIALFCIGTAWWTAGGEQPLYARNNGADVRRPPGADRRGRHPYFPFSYLNETLSLAR